MNQPIIDVIETVSGYALAVSILIAVLWLLVSGKLVPVTPLLKELQQLLDELRYLTRKLKDD